MKVGVPTCLWEWLDCCSLPKKWFLRPDFLRKTQDTQRGKAFEMRPLLKIFLVSVQGIMRHPVGCSVNQRVANTESWPFEPVLNPIIAQLYRAIFKEKTQVRFI